MTSVLSGESVAYARGVLIMFLSAVLSATPPIDPAAEAATRLDLAVWWQPVGTVVGVGVTIANRGFAPIVFVPLGANFAIGETEVATELTFLSMRSAYLIDATFGPLLHTRRGTALDGLFVQPKARFEFGPGVALAGVAVDVGYQWKAGHVYVATVIGGGIGFGLGLNVFDNIASLLLSEGTAAPHLVATVNFNLLRIGYRF